MTSILQISSSLHSTASISTSLATEISRKFEEKFPNSTTTTRDLLSDPLVDFNESIASTFHLQGSQDNHQYTQEQAAIIAKSNALIDEIQSSDIVVIAAPMYNFGISSQLKTYFDWIARPGVTFRFANHRSEGLIKGKKVYVVSTRGGKHLGTSSDAQTPHLKSILTLLGMTDVTFICVEGLHFGNDVARSALEQARAEIARI